MKISTLALAISLMAGATPAYAAGATADGVADGAAEAPGDPSIVVLGQQKTNVAKVPAVVQSITADDIKTSVNSLTSGASIKYLPSLEVRERYIGDRNGIIQTRTTTTTSSAQSVVYADGVTISNLLGNNYAYPPRWGLVAPAEISQVDVIYGPFSAIYPGNSMGGVINLTTHMPDHFEIHAGLTGARQSFHLYGSNQHNYSGDASLAVGDRIGNLTIWATYDHLDAQGQPMSFATTGVSTTAASPTAKVVTGGYQDIDPGTGAARMVFGGYSIDHTVQDQGKIKLAYAFTPSLTLTYIGALWGAHSATQAQSYLTDASGNAVYNGTYNLGGKAYTVVGLNPTINNQLHMMHALGLEQKGTRLDWKLTFSSYTYLTEHNLSASNYGNTTLGSDQNMHNTNWKDIDAQGIWRPADGHEVSFGYHLDNFRLRQRTYALAQWNTYDDGAQTGASFGQTTTQAVYAQDRWKLLESLTLTIGGRMEFWKAQDGSNFSSSTTPNTVTYPSQSRNNFSPKAALAYKITPAITSRFSFGRAVRYPTVAELFQKVTNGTNLIASNPNLLPEDVWAYEWTNEVKGKLGSLRVSLFQENRKNALVSQKDTLVSATASSVTENVASVRFRGVEAAADLHDVLIKGFDLRGSLTYVDGVVRSDIQQPAANGKQFPGVPPWRARAVAVYHQNDKLSYSLGYRHSSGAYSTLTNSDLVIHAYGASSPYDIFDAKVTYRLDNGLTLSAGVDNFTNNRGYVYHPYPNTTGFISIRFDR